MARAAAPPAVPAAALARGVFPALAGVFPALAGVFRGRFFVRAIENVEVELWYCSVCVGVRNARNIARRPDNHMT